MNWTNIISITIGVLGVIGTLYFGIKSRELVEKVRKFDWNDIEAGVKYLNREIERRFKPDIVVTTSAGSASIVASFFISNTEKFIPLYCGISKKIDAYFTHEPQCEKVYKTGRWKTFIPDEVFRHKNARILILDDVTLSGDSLAALTKLLLSHGVKRENIYSASLFATDLSITGKRAPDLYWYRISDTHFYFPWGQSTGKGY
jgi:hypoxanthine phosphoribosyltransferase